jgi:hypothetical protein
VRRSCEVACKRLQVDEGAPRTDAVKCSPLTSDLQPVPGTTTVCWPLKEWTLEASCYRECHYNPQVPPRTASPARISMGLANIANITNDNDVLCCDKPSV